MDFFIFRIKCKSLVYLEFTNFIVRQHECEFVLLIISKHDEQIDEQEIMGRYERKLRYEVCSKTTVRIGLANSRDNILGLELKGYMESELFFNCEEGMINFKF